MSSTRWAPRAAVLVAGGALLAACSVTPTASPGSTGNPFTSGPSTSASPTPSGTGGSGPDDPRLAPFYAQDLAWAPCGGDFQCATLTVPISYDDPTGPTIGLSVLRSRAQGGDPVGSLVLNPGGPGASGVDYARAARVVVSPRVRQNFDIVGFDPRGVGTSDPIECLTGPETDRLLAADGTPDDAKEVADTAEASALVGIRCEERSPELLPYVGTPNAARDMDVLRAALGDETLFYLGKSYGSYLGLTYAELFPGRVGRLVLDGVLPTDLDADQVSLGQAKAFDVALRRFAADCPTHSDCPLPDDPDAGVRRMQEFFASLETNPLPAQPDRPLNEALGTYAVISYLYAPEWQWPLLRKGLAAAFQGDGTPLMDLLDQATDRSSDGEYKNNQTDAFYAISCLDRPWSGGVARAEELQKKWAVEAPTFGPYVAWGNLPCNDWPVPSTEKPHVVTATGAAPIMVVTTRYDPATPYEWGLSVADQLDSAALVTWDGDGHTAYFNGDACVDEAVDAYLIDGTVPQETVSCG